MLTGMYFYICMYVKKEKVVKYISVYNSVGKFPLYIYIYI